MANKRISDNPHWNVFVKTVDPLRTKLDEVKKRNEQRIIEAKAEIEADRKAAVQAALANGISKTAIAKHLGITSGVRQSAFFESVLGSNWLEISGVVSNGKVDKVPFEMGDWRVVRDHINHLREHPLRQGSGLEFCKGSLWNDVLDVRFTFSIDYGDQSTVTYYYEDGSLVDPDHLDQYAGGMYGKVAFDDGTEYARAEPGKWFTEGADVAKWLEIGYRNKWEGWPQP